MTIAIQLITTLGGRLLLLALGVDLPFVVHLFVWALMNFFMLLPVSIAGFGVREASFILLFGLFGVSRETSLAASFLALACTLAAIGPGGLVWLSRAFDRSAGPRAGGDRKPEPARGPRAGADLRSRLGSAPSDGRGFRPRACGTAGPTRRRARAAPRSDPRRTAAAAAGR